MTTIDYRINKVRRRLSNEFHLKGRHTRKTKLLRRNFLVNRRNRVLQQLYAMCHMVPIISLLTFKTPKIAKPAIKLNLFFAMRFRPFFVLK